MLYIHDDSTGKQIAEATVQATKECTRMVGKIGPQFTAEEVDAMEAEVAALHRAVIARKKQMSTHR